MVKRKDLHGTLETLVKLKLGESRAGKLEFVVPTAAMVYRYLQRNFPEKQPFQGLIPTSLIFPDIELDMWDDRGPAVVEDTGTLSVQEIQDMVDAKKTLNGKSLSLQNLPDFLERLDVGTMLVWGEKLTP